MIMADFHRLIMIQQSPIMDNGPFHGKYMYMFSNYLLQGTNLEEVAFHTSTQTFAEITDLSNDHHFTFPGVQTYVADLSPRNARIYIMYEDENNLRRFLNLGTIVWAKESHVYDDTNPIQSFADFILSIDPHEDSPGSPNNAASGGGSKTHARPKRMCTKQKQNKKNRGKAYENKKRMPGKSRK
jgi:hypothetical protein